MCLKFQSPKFRETCCHSSRTDGKCARSIIRPAVVLWFSKSCKSAHSTLRDFKLCWSVLRVLQVEQYLYLFSQESEYCLSESLNIFMQTICKYKLIWKQIYHMQQNNSTSSMCVNDVIYTHGLEEQDLQQFIKQLDSHHSSFTNQSTSIHHNKILKQAPRPNHITLCNL